MPVLWQATTLCRIPPDSSNGYYTYIYFPARASASFLLHFRRARTVSVICRPILTDGFRQLKEILEDHCHIFSRHRFLFADRDLIRPDDRTVSQQAPSPPAWLCSSRIRTLQQGPRSHLFSTLKLMSFIISEAPFSVRYCTLRFLTSSTLICLLFLFPE